MRVRYTVVVYVAPEERVGLIGSIPELGEWKEVKAMAPLYVGADRHHGSTWTVTVNIPSEVFDRQHTFSWKFVKWHCRDSAEGLGPCCVPDHLPQLEVTRSNAGSSSSITLPTVNPLFCSLLHQKPKNLRVVSWEGKGPEDNRKIVYDGPVSDIVEQAKMNQNISKVHLYSPEVNLIDDEYCLPVALYEDEPSSCGEATHTTRYYSRYKSNRKIHYNRITDKLIVGTCPRSPDDLLLLREKEKVSDIVNLQALEDIQENFIDPENVPVRSERNAEYTIRLCEKLNIQYVWLPTKDMCSESRARTVAIAAFIMAGLITRLGPEPCTSIYIHCNAGVGRSIACVAAYLIYCENIPLRLANLFISARRPVAYFDEVALVTGLGDFKVKFGDGAKRLFGKPPGVPDRKWNSAGVTDDAPVKDYS